MKVLRFLNHYSVDVALGAMISSLFFAKVLQVNLSIYTTLLLGLSVWVIYTFDHLEDARGIRGVASTTRHLLHQKYFKRLACLLIVALFLCAVLVFFIPPVTLLWGTVMICAVGIYFIMLKFLGMAFSHYKEFIISIMYSLGVFLGPMSIYEGAFSILHLVLFSQLVFIAFTNLVVFSLYEESEDKTQHFPSLVQAIGKNSTERLLLGAMFIQVLCIGWLFFYTTTTYIPIILGAMSSVLLLIATFRSFFKKGRTYRLVGDAIFLFPLLLLV